MDVHHNTLMSLILVELTSSLERGIKSSTFNQRGGLLLEQEIRTIVSFLSKFSDFPLRHNFLRLNRISRLLSYESIKDIEQYANNMTDSTDHAILTKSEIKQFMVLRCDIPIG
ncbi:hypothetical protein GJ496_011322 [Pomphorhynchus laevis]|nr:hypothetical protein GJ496_011322 [Pomphorhynchus laevis]